MLVESIVRKTLGINRQRVKKVTQENGKLMVYLTTDKRFRLVCSSCGSKASGYDLLPERRWQHVPLWGIPVDLVYAPRRVACAKCGIKVEALPWSHGKSPVSKPLSVVLATWAKLLAWDVVGQLFGFLWNTVRKAVKNVVDYGLEHRDIDNVLYIGIDEISRRKGHVYQTHVYDLTEKRLLWSGEDRTAAALESFFDQWGEEHCEKIEAVCCDMWAPYVDVIKSRLPNAILVFDKFHIIRHLMDAVDQVRRAEVRQYKTEDPTLLNNTRYIWLKNHWNLTELQQTKLRDLQSRNLKIFRAYLLKEAFRKFWSYTYPGWAKKYLKQWFWWATHSRLKPMRNFAWLLRDHEEDILNYFKVRIDNGAVEGLNNKAKTICHKAYGYRSSETFSLAMYHGLGKLPMPQLTHKFV
jgi:transposase